MTEPVRDEWERRRRMLSEQCEGCGNRREQIYALDLFAGIRLWLCRSCWHDSRRRNPGATEVLWEGAS